MVRLTSSAVEVCDAGDISRAALCLVEETRCAVGRGSLLGLRVLAGRKSKCRSSEEGDGGRELHLESLMGVLGEAVRVLMRTDLLYRRVDGDLIIHLPFWDGGHVHRTRK
jgi:hypothetical protein